MHTQQARKQVILVLVPPESHPGIRILGHVIYLGDAFISQWSKRMENFNRERKGVKERHIIKKD